MMSEPAVTGWLWREHRTDEPAKRGGRELVDSAGSLWWILVEDVGMVIAVHHGRPFSNLA
jgi:hypothetical protein